MVATRLAVLCALIGIAAGCQKQAATTPMASVTPEPEEMLEPLVIYEPGTEVSYASCPFEEPPPLESFMAQGLPEFRADRNRASNYLEGDERLDDQLLHEVMQPFQSEVFRCLDIAACYVDDELFGEIDVQMEVTSTGKVRAATVTASTELSVDPVVPCARAALAQLEFPRVDGGNTFVSHSLTIE